MRLMSEQSKPDVLQLVGKAYQDVIETLQHCGFQIQDVKLKANEVIVEFYAGAYTLSYVDCTLYKLSLEKLNRISIKVMLCEAGGWPFACIYLNVAVPREKQA